MKWGCQEVSGSSQRILAGYESYLNSDTGIPCEKAAENGGLVFGVLSPQPKYVSLAALNTVLFPLLSQVTYFWLLDL